MKAIDLFSGAGGFSLAAINAQIDVLAAVELNPAAIATYKNNIIPRSNTSIKTYNADILKLEPQKVKKELKLRKGELDLILGGPPCQGFSSHRIKDAGVDDPRNQLLLRYFDFVDTFRPKVFLVENVTGLLWKRHEEYLQNFKDLARENEYEIEFCGTLNAKDYGIPQNRKRVFILGRRKDTCKNRKGFSFPPSPTHFSPTSSMQPHWVPASSVFEPIPEKIVKRFWKDFFSKKLNISKNETDNIFNNLPHGDKLNKEDTSNIYMKPSLRMIQRFKDTPLNGSREDAGEKHQLPCHSNGYKGHKDVYGRIFIHQPSNTITTGCNNPSKGRFVHPWKNHGITLRHAARLQTFPDSFSFEGNSTEQAKQIGNAVPPLLGEVLIKSIFARSNK